MCEVPEISGTRNMACSELNRFEHAGEDKMPSTFPLLFLLTHQEIRFAVSSIHEVPRIRHF